MFLRVSIVAALVCFSIFLGRLWVDSGPLRLASSTNNRADELTSTLLIGGSKLDVTIESGNLKVSHAELLHWVQSAAEAVATYYGRYPVPHVQIRIIPVDGSGVRHGQTFGSDGGVVMIWLRSRALASAVANDCVLAKQ